MKTIIAIIMFVCAISTTPTLGQITPSALGTFKTKMLEKKSYAGVVLHEIKKISPNDFMGDIEGSIHRTWNVQISGDTILSSYDYWAPDGSGLRMYMKTNITTGECISLQRNSSGNIYWWSETWTPTYTTKESCKVKKAKLPKRLMKPEELKCINMFETIITMVNGTFSTGNSEADSVLYNCFKVNRFAKDVKAGEWESSFLNELFDYTFTKSGIRDGKKGVFIIHAPLLAHSTEEIFRYFTVDPNLTTEIPGGFKMEGNPNFNWDRDVVSVPMKGKLLPELWQALK